MKTTIALFTALSLAAAAALRAEERPAPPPADIVLPDTPCRIVRTEKPQFPVRMLKEGVTHGSARVLVHVDATGTITDQLVVASSRAAFAEEAQRVLGTWTFEPARIAGALSDSILDLTFRFDVSEVVYVEKFGTAETPAAEDELPFEYHASSLDDLDQMPKPLAITSPVYPEEWRVQGIVGRTTIQFYIDETGRVRFPSVLKADHDNLGALAAAAVRQWRFAPPTSQGKPVLVRARQVFSFGLEKAPAS
jgi:TonB family protein